jgi:hypothetical protein
MSLKIARTTGLAAILALVGAMSVATTAASARTFFVHVPFKNWVASGTVTPKKLNEPITLPEGSTFNGEALLDIFTYTGTASGTLFVPPFTATMKILGVPETVGINLTQVGAAQGTVEPAPQAKCPGASGGGSLCATLSVTAHVNLAITVVGVLGINIPTTCETSEPITFNLKDTLTLKELLEPGPRFTGTTTLPTMQCGGLEGVVLAPVLTTLISGPDNPYVLSIGPHK